MYLHDGPKGVKEDHSSWANFGGFPIYNSFMDTFMLILHRVNIDKQAMIGEVCYAVHEVEHT